MKKSKEKVSKESAFFMIMLFVVGGFTIIMLSIIQGTESGDYVDEDSEHKLSEADFEEKARNQVVISSLFKDHGADLVLTGKKRLGCVDCWEFKYKFDAVNTEGILDSVTGFEFNIRIINGDVRLTEVFEVTG